MPITVKCYSCSRLLTEENVSVEHIIPQSIGGRLKSKELLCRDCNSTYGDGIDSALFKAFESFTALLAVKRERTDVLPVLKNLRTTSGELYTLRDGRLPELSKPTIQQHERGFYISARNEKEIRQIISGLKRKYPRLDDSNLEERLKWNKEYMDEPLHISFNAGGELLLRAVAKTSINWYLHSKGDPQYINEILDVVKGKAENDKHIFYYPISESLRWEDEEVSHLIYVRGSAEGKILFAYVVLFSSFAYIVSLSDAYDGSDYESLYCFDVVSGCEIERKFSMDYVGRKEFVSQFSNQEFSIRFSEKTIASYQAGASRVVAIGDWIQTKRGIHELTEAAMNELNKKYPEGFPATEEFLQEFAKLVGEKAGPFVAHYLNRDINKRNDHKQ